MAGMRSPAALPAAVAHRAFSRVDGHRHGVGDNRLRRSDLTAPFSGVRVPAGAPPGGFLDRCRSYAVRLRPGQFFSHETAARLWRMPTGETHDLQSPPLHVSALTGCASAPTARNLRGHDVSDRSVSVQYRFGLPVSDVVSTWMHMGSIWSVHDLVAAGDAIVFAPRYPMAGDERPFTTIAELRKRLATYRGRGKRRLAFALELVREAVESPMETHLRLLIVRSGLPEPAINVDITDDSGRFLGRADLYYPRYGIVVEYDGDHHRRNRTVYAADQQRIADLRDNGQVVIRVMIEGLRGEAHRTVALVRKELLAAGWRPTHRQPIIHPPKSVGTRAGSRQKTVDRR